MTLGGKPSPVYVVSDDEVAAGKFTVEAGPAIAVSSLSALARGVSGGHAMPVYVVDAGYVNANGIRDGLRATPVVDTTGTRPVGGLQRATPVYVTYGTLGSGGGEPETSGLSAEAIAAMAAWWKMDEESGTRVDSHGDHDASVASGAPGYVEGVIENAVSLASATADFLQTDTHADMMGGARDWTICFWVNFSSLNSESYLLSDMISFYIWNIDDYVIMEVVDEFLDPVAAAEGYFTLDQWEFMVFWYNSSEGQAYFQLNDDEPVTTSTSPGTVPSPQPSLLSFGTTFYEGLYADASLDEVAWFPGHILSAEDRTFLYNSGSGVTYEEATGIV